MSLAVALTLALSIAAAYPTKDEEAYYYNRLRELPDYKQDSRNLDGIGGNGDDWPAALLARSLKQDNTAEKGAGQTPDFVSSSHLDGIGGGHLVRGLELEGGGNLLRDLDMLKSRAAYFDRNSRPMDSIAGSTLGGQKRGIPCCDSIGGNTVGSLKRNMDEIDRSSFNSFVKKNFDEIDRSGFGSFTKRNFDEIDRSGFGSFVKRGASPAQDQPNGN